MTKSHERERAEIARKTAEFLAKGGEVQDIPVEATGDRTLIAIMTGQKRGPQGISYRKDRHDA